MYTLSEENYLKAIYRLSDDGLKASTSASRVDWASLRQLGPSDP